MSGGRLVADKSKVWVIDPVEPGAQKSRSGKMGFERTDYSPDDQAPGSGTSGSRARDHRKNERVDEKGSPAFTLLAYLAGPYAILTTRRGRESRFWVSLAILSCTAAAITLARADKIFSGPHGTGTIFLLWLLLACFASVAGFAAWARGVLLLGRHKGWLLRRLPAWVGHPGIAGIFGLVVPGFGLFITEHPKRAACVIMTACSTAVSALVLAQAPALWRLSQAAGPLAGQGYALEQVFLVMGAIIVLGAFAWIVQALDGARLAGHRTDGVAAQLHGDWAAVALIMAIMGLLVTFEPSQVAETLDRFAVSMREDGLRVIPLYASYAAMRLDPSQPAHTVQVIELSEDLGRLDAAFALRRELAEKWKPYERMRRLEASAAETIEPAVFGPGEP
jgi:hypothetical protein